MFLLRKFKDILLLLKKNKPQAYYFSWVLLIFLIVYFLNISFDEIIFFIILTSFFILKISPKITAVLTLSLLVLSFTFLVILKDKPLGELSAIYAYLSLGIIIVIGAKILLGKEKNKEDNRLPLKTLRNINFQKVNIFILLLLAFALFQKTLVTGGMIESGDLSFALYPERVLGSLSLWNSYGSMAGATTPNLFPFASINFGLSSFFHLSGELTVKLIILEAILLGIFSAYFLAKKIFQPYAQNKNYLEIASSWVAIFYLFNPYSLNRILHLHIWVAYLFLPLILLLFLKLLETQKMRYAAILAFILSFISFSPHYLIYVFLALGLLAGIKIIHFFWQKRPGVSSYSILGKNIAPLCILFFCFILFSSHWLIPYLKASFARQEIQMPGYVLTQEYFKKPGAKFEPIVEILSLKGAAPESRILNLFFKILIFILPPTLLLPFLIYITIRINTKKDQKKWNKIWVTTLKYKHLNLSNQYTIFFSLLGILAAVISTLPIWNYDLYQKIIFDIPYLKNFGWLFRESFRICGLLALSYSFLLGFLFLKLMNIHFKENL